MKELHKALKAKQQQSELETLRMEYAAWLPQFLIDVKEGGLDELLSDVIVAAAARRRELVAQGVVPAAAVKRVPRRRDGKADPDTTQAPAAPQQPAQGTGTATILDPLPVPNPDRLDPATYGNLYFVPGLTRLPRAPFTGIMRRVYGNGERYFTLADERISKSAMEDEIVVVSGFSPFDHSLVIINEIKQSFLMGRLLAWPRTLEANAYRHPAKVRRILAAAKNGNEIKFSTALLKPYL